jgi:hypothetical protein
MRKIILSAIIISAAFAGKAQNLVPNGDFEQYTTCPNSIGQFDVVTTWLNPSTATPDYFNQCAGATIEGVPDNLFGYQFAHSGDGYAGAYLFEMFDTVAYDYREYIEVPLTAPLVANNCYHFEMYVSLAEKLSNYTTSDYGVYFSDSLISGLATQNTLPFTPQISNSTGYITDTLNWVLIEGDYTATGGENHLMIGNFRDDTVIDTIQVGPDLGHSIIYFFIDDVSLTLCTGIEEQSSNSEINVYPNPVKNELMVSGLKLRVGSEATIKVFDVLGKEMHNHLLAASNFQLPTSNFKSGIYFMEINDGKNIFRKKFLKE